MISFSNLKSDPHYQRITSNCRGQFMICSSFVCHTVVLVMDLASASSVDHPSADDLLLWSSLADFFSAYCPDDHGKETRQ